MKNLIDIFVTGQELWIEISILAFLTKASEIANVGRIDTKEKETDILRWKELLKFEKKTVCILTGFLMVHCAVGSFIDKFGLLHQDYCGGNWIDAEFFLRLLYISEQSLRSLGDWKFEDLAMMAYVPLGKLAGHI